MSTSINNLDAQLSAVYSDLINKTTAQINSAKNTNLPVINAGQTGGYSARSATYGDSGTTTPGVSNLGNIQALGSVVSKLGSLF